LATATTPNAALGVQKNDRATGFGDIEVFDLEALRSGKAERGTDLKTAGLLKCTVPVRGLDVSADGKTLTVLFSRQPAGEKAGQASLRQYDTADMKKVREKDLIQPAWDMVRSADGKSFLVTGFPGTGAQSLITFDAATLTPKSNALPAGSVHDLALAPEGRIVVTVGATNGAAGKLMLTDPAGGLAKEIPTTPSRLNQNGYARFTPDGKQLFVTSHGFGLEHQQQLQPQQPPQQQQQVSHLVAGLDVFEVADPADPAGYKKVATIRHAGGVVVGGNFQVSPDGQRLVFQTGAVLATDKLTEHVGGVEPQEINYGALPGGGPGVGGGFPGGMQPGGPGGPPGGLQPGGPGGPGGRFPGGRPGGPGGPFPGPGGLQPAQPGGGPGGPFPGPGGMQPAQPGGGPGGPFPGGMQPVQPGGPGGRGGRPGGPGGAFPGPGGPQPVQPGGPGGRFPMQPQPVQPGGIPPGGPGPANRN
ncbi:MAG TPA: hypothetical protein VH092_00070, partial [Urbifossiella sp.]|nr:hypothetical protein [Urbifossiella sp.]